MFKNKKKKKEENRTKKSFTFIEVMIIVAIIGIMTTMVLSFTQRSKHNTELEASANEIVASIRKIQNYALSGKNISPGCSKYRFFAPAGADNFSIDNDSPTCPSKTYKLKNGVVFGDTSKEVKFNAPFANRDNSNTVDIVVVKGSYSYHICVTGVGVITMQGSAC